jgi:ATP-dependent DNA helicase RecG
VNNLNDLESKNMEMRGFQDLWQALTEGDESSMIEAKTASQVGKSLLETISAFANEPDANGGYLLLGVSRDKESLFPEYEIRGIDKPDKLQSDLACQCRESFSTPISPRIVPETVNGKCVLVVFIPEAEPQHKPVYIKNRGVTTGSFRRIGPTDQRCNDADFALFYQSQGGSTFDETQVDGTNIGDVDLDALASYRESISKNRQSADLSKLSDKELLFALNATTGRDANAPLTLAGLLVFGTTATIRRKRPMTRVDYIRVDGTEWVSDTEQRYQTVEKVGPLLQIIPQMINLVLDDIPKAFHLPEQQIYREDRPLVPKKVIRETIVNALMHRNYRANQPVQIIRFSNRIEVTNPGYSLVPDERLGESGSRTRNPKVAAVLHEVGLAETKGTGIKVMREAMMRANLSSPLILSDRPRDEFRVSLFVHNLLGPADVEWLGKFSDCGLSEDEARALIMLRELKEIDNATYRQINDMDSLTASGHLRRLKGMDLLEKVGQGATTKYRPGPRFFQKTRVKRPKVTEPLTDAQCEELEAICEGLPKEIKNQIGTLQKRKIKELEDFIVRMCGVRPFSAAELALATRRSLPSLRSRTLKKLVNNGELEMLYPEEPSHPNQKYVSAIIKN